jgi:hypothetical protein
MDECRSSDSHGPASNGFSSATSSKGDSSRLCMPARRSSQHVAVVTTCTAQLRLRSHTHAMIANERWHLLPV